MKATFILTWLLWCASYNFYVSSIDIDSLRQDLIKEGPWKIYQKVCPQEEGKPCKIETITTLRFTKTVMSIKSGGQSNQDFTYNIQPEIEQPVMTTSDGNRYEIKLEEENEDGRKYKKLTMRRLRSATNRYVTDFIYVNKKPKNKKVIEEQKPQ